MIQTTDRWTLGNGRSFHVCGMSIWLLYEILHRDCMGNAAALLVLATGLVCGTVAVVHAAAPAPADQWAMIKDLLSDAERGDGGDLDASLALVADARSAYDETFGSAAAVVDPDSHAIVEEAFDAIAEDHAAGDVAHAKLMRQAVDKTIYRIAYAKIVQALGGGNGSGGDPEQFAAWFGVMDAKFSLSEKHPELSRMAEEVSAAGTAAGSDGIMQRNAGPILDGLLEIFKIKTLEEPEEAVIALGKGDITGAQKFAYEGYYYYRTLHPAVEAELGVQRAGELLGHMEEVMVITESGRPAQEMAADVEDVLGRITAVIREYEGRGDLSDTAMALAGIRDRLGLVDAEYVDAVMDGKIVDQIEYDEAAAFLERASAIYEENRGALAALSEDDTEDLGAILLEMDGVISDVGGTSDVGILTGKAINRVAALEDLAGGAVDTSTDMLAYFDEIERLLGEARTAYREGDADAAFDLVSTAYLDNYEFVEGPLGDADPELMLRIEVDMRENLRTMIKNGAPPGEVDAQIDSILVDLDSAKVAIPEFGTVMAAAVLAAALAATLALSARSGLWHARGGPGMRVPVRG